MRIFWLILCLFALPVHAEVFTYVDAQGNRVYTDQPRGNAKRVPIATSNRMSANPTAAAPLRATQKSPEPPLFHYDMLRILIPEPDATIRSSAGEVIVSVTSQPALQPGHRYRLLLDGQAQGSSTSPQFRLHNLDRGSHSLAAEIVDADGRVLARSPSQSVHLQRHSVQHTRPTPRAKPPQP